MFNNVVMFNAHLLMSLSVSLPLCSALEDSRWSLVPCCTKETCARGISLCQHNRYLHVNIVHDIKAENILCPRSVYPIVILL